MCDEAPEAREPDQEGGLMSRNPEPPEKRPPDEPIRCRHCGEVDPDDHDDGCPQVRAEEQAPDVHPEAPGDDMIIPERDRS